MTEAPPIRLEAATGLCLGQRELQEDAVLAEMADGAGGGLIALADGCGGHARGDLAANIAADVALRAFDRAEGAVPERLREATDAANLAVHARALDAPELEGMSTTLLLVHVGDARLHWASVGDSPLYHLRAGGLERLNATHSLARHLDLLVEMGEMAAEDAAGHPARSCLTSALGSAEIEELDCPDEALDLLPGDVVLAASDGLLTLTESAIRTAISDPDTPAAEMVDRLLRAVEAAGAEAQDNTSLAVLQARPAPAARLSAPETGPQWLPRRAFAALVDAFRAGGPERARGSGSRG